jgi:hypothetical protein
MSEEDCTRLVRRPVDDHRIHYAATVRGAAHAHDSDAYSRYTSEQAPISEHGTDRCQWSPDGAANGALSVCTHARLRQRRSHPTVAGAHGATGAQRRTLHVAAVRLRFATVFRERSAVVLVERGAPGESLAMQPVVLQAIKGLQNAGDCGSRSCQLLCMSLQHPHRRLPLKI